MTCEQAKEIAIVELLEHCHIRPAYTRGQDHWYLSPLRDENTPSFKVNTKLNLYYDHGTGKGGDIIDLGRALFKCDTKTLLEKLGSGLFSFQQQLPSDPNQHIVESVTPDNRQPAIQITGTKDLGNSTAIGQYLQSRGIDLAIARLYCRQVHYQVGDKNYFAAGFANRSGGYELRSPYFKGSSSPKDITHIENGSKSICVLEGFMDLLSLLTLQKNTRPVLSDFLILNSVSLADRSLDTLAGYRNVFLYLDHDEAGKRVEEKYQLAGLKTVDASGTYQGYKDLNEYLINQKPVQKEVKQRQEYKKSQGLGM